jgi:hypothetical protein
MLTLKIIARGTITALSLAPLLHPCQGFTGSWLGYRSVRPFDWPFFDEVDIGDTSLQEVANGARVYFAANSLYTHVEAGFPLFKSEVCGNALTELLNQCVPGATNLRLLAEYYQWKEIKISMADENCAAGFCNAFTFQYEKVWTSNIINSSEFHDMSKTNPSQYRYHSAEFPANNCANVRLASGG